MTMSEQTVRAFVAVEIPGPGRTFLESVTSELRRAGADVRWVRPEGIHITLKFLGQIRADLISALEKNLTALFVDYSPVQLAIRGLGAFPSLARPRVIWAGIHDPSGTLSSMASSAETALEPLGFERERRTFSPHLTLGRVRSGSGVKELVDAIRQRMDLAGPEFVSREAVLFQSILKPSGAEYRAISRFALSKG
jgi:2'-5' RNA ligase